MPRRVENVDLVLAEVEAHGRCGDAYAPVLLHLHEVGGGAPLLALLPDRAGLLDGAAVQEELLGHGGLSRVRMRNDRDVPSPHHLRGGRLEGVGRRRRAEAESEWRYYAGKDEDEEEERKADEGGGQNGVHAAAK
eukprot:CAMPEP_0182484124 /NCGR_PEP_ID=MMETSP1319-20130603/42858_1 /TAXON_ID=172717 /ORGANISM="Bolidomonas pacifica, Strain RCC208" /LENGTH=134 /DNA_ID=CAMNT_0024685995 /DNA_START=51 /DNA_END=455 /DNA_ORIENTATION=-